MVNKYPNIADTLGIIAVAAATCKAQPDMAIEAVQYVDGDSGILVAELFQDCLKAYKNIIYSSKGRFSWIHAGTFQGTLSRCS